MEGFVSLHVHGSNYVVSGGDGYGGYGMVVVVVVVVVVEVLEVWWWL